MVVIETVERVVPRLDQPVLQIPPNNNKKGKIKIKKFKKERKKERKKESKKERKKKKQKKVCGMGC